MLKVLFLTNILNPYRISMFNSLAERNKLDFVVFCMSKGESNRKWILEEEKIKFIYKVLPGFHIKIFGESMPETHVNIGISKYIYYYKPDYVISGGFTWANLESFVFCKLYGVKFICWGELTKYLYESKIGLIRKGIRKLLIKYSNGCIGSSSEAVDSFIFYGAKKENIGLAVMSTDIDYYIKESRKYDDLKDLLKEKYKYPDILLLFIGQLIYRKGLHFILEIIPEIQKKVDSLGLIILGDGPLINNYKEIVKSKNIKSVYFQGYVQQNEISKYLALADIFVFPTLFDPFGAVLEEAMAAKLSVISSPYAAATRDLIIDGENGFIVDPNDKKKLIEKILMLIENKDLRISIGKRAVETVKLFNSNNEAEKIESFIVNLNRKIN